MPVKRAVHRKSHAQNPIERKLYLRQRKEEAPQGFVTRRTLCEKVGLTNVQFRALVASDVLLSDGVNSHGYALYTNATIERLHAMKHDGSLFRTLRPTTTMEMTEATPDRGTDTHPSLTLHYSAEDGVRVFELLRDGKTLEEVVLETRIHPMLVKAIRVDYDDLTGAICLPRRVVDRLNELGTQGKLPGGFPLREGADVLAILEFCSVDRTCLTCETNAALTSCEDCLAKERRAALSGMSRSA